MKIRCSQVYWFISVSLIPFHWKIYFFLCQKNVVFFYIFDDVVTSVSCFLYSIVLDILGFLFYHLKLNTVFFFKSVNVLKFWWEFCWIWKLFFLFKMPIFAMLILLIPYFDIFPISIKSWHSIDTSHSLVWSEVHHDTIYYLWLLWRMLSPWWLSQPFWYLYMRGLQTFIW